MPLPSQSLDDSAISSPSVEALLIARFRGSLDWMLTHPSWEDCLVCSLNELGFKGKRQGINQRNALRTLPIEQKQEIARHALGLGLPRPSHDEAKRFAKHWGVTQYRGRSDFSPPSEKQWRSLQQRALVGIATRYERYKKAQSSLFSDHHALPVESALSICKKPSHREDACQEARLALLEAIDRIDPCENFEAYARTWIKRRVTNFLMQERLPLKAPINLLSKSFRGESGSNPTLEKAIREGTVRLDDPLCDSAGFDPSLSTEKEEAPNESATAADDAALVAYALSHLTDKQRQVVELRFGLGDEKDGQSLAEVAQKTGISRQQVFQREKRALKVLKGNLAPLLAERSSAPDDAGDY